MAEWNPPTEFDGYRLLRPIGRGGMGRVFLAQDTLLERPVAIKFLLVADADEHALRRFQNEARAIARLSHPNVVTIYRVGTVQSCPYLVSEYVRGTSLDRIVVPITWQRALELGLPLARALALAHRRGVVHRDIKPANVMLTSDGEVKLLDFGIAKLIDPMLVFRTFEGDTLAAPWPPGTPSEPRIRSAKVLTPSDLDDERDSGLTRPGTVLGTPQYMAPEVWKGEVATFASDVYSLGALLFTLTAGRPPHAETDYAALLWQVCMTDAMPLGEAAVGVDGRFAAVVDQCLRRDPQARFATGNELRAALEQVLPGAYTQVVPEGNPYRGLRPFEAEHRALYFGRDSEMRAILERLTTDALVVVAGDSGVGKSSLCRAGVLPRISEWLDRDRRWSVAQVVPGRHPLTTLSAVVAAALRVSEDRLSMSIGDDPSSFGRDLRRQLGRERGMVLFLDQLEELVTLGDPEEVVAIAEVLSRLSVLTPGVRVLATVRGDFLSRLAATLPVGDALARALYFLRPLSPERIREAIVEPARVKGVRFESTELVDVLIESTAHAEGGLPLLQFALAQLWEKRDAKQQLITRAALDSLGGVAGALARHADDVVAQMLPPERQAARQILLRLVTASATRARRTDAELVSGNRHATSALDALVRGRLVVARETPEGPSFEIAHEALLSWWGTLARWLSSDAEGRAVRDRLAGAAAEWERLGRARDVLWGDRQIAETAGVDLSDLFPKEHAFLDASRSKVRWARALRIGSFLGVPLVVALTYAGLVVRARAELTRRVDAQVRLGTATLEQARAEVVEARAARSRAFQLFDKPNLPEAERAWALALGATSKADASLRKAAQGLETAFILDPERRDVRALLVDALYDRAIVADERSARGEVEELLQRVSLYDRGDGHLAAWRAPARVVFRITPRPSELTLDRYVEAQDGVLRKERVDVPVSLDGPFSLAPGSYVVAARAPDHAPVLAPFVVGRDERFELSLALPRPLPKGFVYVPPGRFAFGSAAEDSVRRSFFHTVPVHTVELGAYLIGKYETTFGEWVEFLRDLSPSERAQHLPRVDKGGFEGALTMKELADGAWQLTVQPTTQAYTVKSGETLVYRGRDRRTTQRWERFPVLGISIADAEAYAQWLHRTGRVRGARLCTELEWERAARGADGREFPHGSVLGVDDANFDDTYAKEPAGMGPDEVGSHLASESPFGLHDMAGNVWEWTRSSLVPNEHAARGGSFAFGPNTSRCASREETEPTFRAVSVGVRLCADAQPR